MTAFVTLTLPSAANVATAGRVAAAQQAANAYVGGDIFERATDAAFRLAAVYPIADNAVEVFISPEAVTYAAIAAVPGYGKVEDFRTGDSIAESAATTVLDLAAQEAGVPLSRGLITTVAPGTLRLTW